MNQCLILATILREAGVKYEVYMADLIVTPIGEMYGQRPTVSVHEGIFKIHSDGVIFDNKDRVYFHDAEFSEKVLDLCGI